ncbi:MAG TPA: hypothetical protein ENK60_09000 [Anaerolineae bacterium]|nr:hypothetical protein [Anaerolineae bacterium]
MKAWNHRWLAGLMAVAALFVLAWLGLAPGGPLARAQSLTQVDQFGGVQNETGWQRSELQRPEPQRPHPEH